MPPHVLVMVAGLFEKGMMLEVNTMAVLMDSYAQYDYFFVFYFRSLITPVGNFLKRTTRASTIRDTP